MATTTVNMFYLGNFDDIDTDESDADTESGAELLGSYGQPQVFSLTENDANNSGTISDDEFNSGGDSMSYDVGNGATTVELDSTSHYKALLTLGDGSQITVSVGVLQMENGDVFIRDVGNQLDNHNIQDFELTQLVNSRYSGQYTGNSIENTKAVCFAQGTLIETDQGPCNVERLQIGNRVLTADKGYQPIRWIGCGVLKQPGKHAPVIISANALGAGFPSRELRLSPQHRVLISSAIVSRMFGVREALVPALRLLELDEVNQADHTKAVRYWHILTDEHQLVCANGAWAETLFPGPEALKVLTPEAVEELKEILPEVLDHAPMRKVRYVPHAKKQKRLILRHLRNAKPLFDMQLESNSSALPLNARICSLTREDTFETARFVE
ncbi:Hint domain-containing protein [Planktotalea sp.]|uniref:Hint domain-containing protein n=1 Tax=Planktotalea sp. TaxID=2029877 RepID=UPI0032987BA1